MDKEQNKERGPEPKAEARKPAASEGKPESKKLATSEAKPESKKTAASEAKPEGKNPAESEPKTETKKPAAAAKKKKIARAVGSAIAHIQATFNNTIVSITDRGGSVVAWASGGRVGFKGSRKSTAFAAQLVAEKAGNEAKAAGVRELEIWVNGPGSGRESAVRALAGQGFTITVIRDVTPIPHNGCRPPKRRRV